MLAITPPGSSWGVVGLVLEQGEGDMGKLTGKDDRSCAASSLSPGWSGERAGVRWSRAPLRSHKHPWKPDRSDHVQHCQP